MTEVPLRVLVVDDTIVYRRILSEVVGEIEGTELMGTAAHGRLALTKMERVQPDLVLLDVEMPEMDGLETLAMIKKKYPAVGVIMVSGANQSAAKNTVLALERGALDFINKPEASSPEASKRQLLEQLRPLIRVFQTRRNLRASLAGPTASVSAAAPTKMPSVPAAEAPAAPVPERRGAAPTRFDILAIGVSTGGPNALAEFLPGLPGDIGVPVVLVQHMPPVFTASLADHLNKKTALMVKEAQEDEALQANTVYIAPGGKHMVVRGSGEGKQRVLSIGLNMNPPENSCRPSVDVLFRSVAAQYEGNILAVVLTGMGADGREGVRVMKRRGCYCLTQDEVSCVVYGMPQAVAAAGLSDEQVPLGLMAQRVTALLRKGH